MKKAFYILLAVALAFVSCQTEFEDPADPQTNPQEEARTLPNSFSVTAVESIKLAEVKTEMVQIGKLGASNLPEDAAYGAFTVVLDDKQSLEADEELKVKKSDLQAAVSALYGLKPEVRTMKAIVKSSVQIEGQGFKLASNEFEVKVAPEAPVLEEHYYYVGAANGWSSTDKTYELTNASGKDFYEDPVISVTIPAPVDDKGDRADNWFKIAPGSHYDAEDFWAGEFIGAAENGASDYEGKFVVSADAGAFNVGPATEEAKFYSITLNLLDQTYKVVAQNFTEYIYYIGNGTGWSVSIPLRSANLDGKYVGFGYVDGEFKFKPNEDNWDGDYECVGEGQLGEGGTNCPAPATSGYYKIEVDLAAMTYKLSDLITTIGVVGPGQTGGWDGDTDMTFNPATGAWEATMNLLKDEIKFRANDAWDINWGGALDALTQGGANILVPDATEYKIQLWAWCDVKAHATLTRTDGQSDPEPTDDFADYFYAIGGNTDWSGVYPLRSGQAGGVNNGKYKGFGYLSQEFKFKPNEDNWTGDLECVGEGQVGQGSDNCPAPAAGYYMIELDLTAMTYTLTPITTIGIIGPAQAGSWDSDTDMTYNLEGGYWEIAGIALSAGDMKFRANDDWAINWGGSFEALTQGGDNIAVAAGTYDVKLYAWCDGKAYATLTEASAGVMVPTITVDGDTTDWTGDGIVSFTCKSDAELTGMKSVKALYSDKFYFLFEFSDEALAKGVSDGKLRLHFFFGKDGHSGLARYWKPADIIYMLEGKATASGAYATFSSKYYLYGSDQPNAWSWTAQEAIPTCVCAGDGNFYEMSMDYSNYPETLGNTITVGFDCADGDYNVLGYLPNDQSAKATLTKIQ